ncbi:hypothetical protein D3C79_808530 [compost metagenome]
MSPAVRVRVPSSVASRAVELSKVPSNLLVVANLLTVILYWPLEAPALLSILRMGLSLSWVILTARLLNASVFAMSLRVVT